MALDPRSRRARRAIALVVPLAAGAAACQLIVGIESRSVFVEPDAESATDAPAVRDSTDDQLDAGRTATLDGCVIVRASQDFCIDETEVTVAAYAQFLEDTEKDAAGLQPSPSCDFNVGFQPSNWFAQRAAGVENPVVFVDWCDAFAYCRWAGKRLCGRIGGGPVVGSANGNVPEVSQWYRACTNGGPSEFPYGDTYEPARCVLNDATSSAGPPPSPVKSAPGCVTPTGIFDMSGNVAEWEDSCQPDTGELGSCRARGLKNPVTSPAEMSCAAEPIFARGEDQRNVGIRCCFDLALAPDR